MSTSILESHLPTYDVSDAVAVTVGADRRRTWEALKRVDLIEVGRRRPLVAALGALRAMPELADHLLHGRRPPQAPQRLTLEDLTAPGPGSWIVLGEEPETEIALGLVGKFWRPVIEYVDLEPAQFAAFARPGYAKTIYSLALTPRGPAETLLTGTMRTLATDAAARRWFNRYWTLGVGSGAHVLVRGLLETVRADAEANPAPVPA